VPAAPSPSGGGAAPTARRPGVGSRPRSPESMARRRRWAAAGYLPPKLAAAFTAGEPAVLAGVGREAARRGKCTLAKGAIAALAGVCECLVKRALRHAALLGLITIEVRRLSYWRNDTNIVRVASREWGAWLRTRLPRDVVPGFGGVGGCLAPARISVEDRRERRRRFEPVPGRVAYPPKRENGPSGATDA